MAGPILALIIGASAAVSPGATSTCPLSFPQFWTMFIRSARYQAAHTAPVLVDTRVVDAGGGEPTLARTMVRRERLAFPVAVVPNGYVVLTRRLSSHSREVTVSREDTDMQVRYTFHRQGCWTLVRRDDDSL
ncbi:hypothetical protein [uncultured Sphingomonas sp.]|uniref:hypothetical protein n=1 Tax=uncultured Sphingomonas sp. TaxID=158754 RepID=UPI0025E36A2B|nr:hypothetical protein [uncultured Sphingomonas sp.]